MWTLPSDAFTGTGLVRTIPATGVNCVSGLIPGAPVGAGPASAGGRPRAASVPARTTPPSRDRSMRTSRRDGVVIHFGPLIRPTSEIACFEEAVLRVRFRDASSVTPRWLTSGQTLPCNRSPEHDCHLTCPEATSTQQTLLLLIH